MNERIKTLRTFLELNQTDFAERIGITQSTLSYIESGKTAYTDRNIKAICQAFNVNEEWLRHGKGDMINKFDNRFEELVLSGFRKLGDMDKKIISEYIKLKPEQRLVIKEYIRGIFR